MRMPTVMGHNFGMLPSVNIPRSQFDLSHANKFTFDAGLLVPFFIAPILPGDTFRVDPRIMIRLTTPLRPFMDNLYADVHWFFAPKRLLWNNFEKYMGAQDDPGDTTDYLVPVMGGGSPVGSNTLGDYLGIPPSIVLDSMGGVSALPFRMYNLTFNQWYRDENMVDSVVVDKDDGPDALSDYVLLSRGKRHDYFTSCLPFAQKGTAVSLPLGTVAPVRTDVAAGSPISVYRGGSSYVDMATSGAQLVPGTNATALASRFYADLSQATAASINQLRQAIAVQQLLERDARGGTRYTEIVRAHFGVISPDARLQRVEYLGGGTFPIVTNPVSQQSASPASPTINDGLGVLGGIGTGALTGGRAGFIKSFTEHGYVMGIVSVRADLTYQQGIQRDWFKRTRVEEFWPDLAGMGEQAVTQGEIFAGNVEADNDIVFGYNGRYDEYRFIPSRIGGLFRSDASGTLDVWHLSQDFGSAPSLDEDFISEDPPIDRVIAVPTQPHFYLDSWVSIKAARPLPLYGVPGLRRL